MQGWKISLLDINILLNDTFNTASLPLFISIFHCFGWVNVPSTLVFTTHMMLDAKAAKLLVCHFWNSSASRESSPVINFSPTLFSRFIIQGIACIIKSNAAFLPSTPQSIACIINSNWSSTFKVSCRRFLRHSRIPWMLSFQSWSLVVNKLLSIIATW